MKIKLTRQIILNHTGLRINLEHDFIKYYQWLIHKYYYNCIKTHTPAHGAHISIITKKLHPKQFIPEKLQKYHKKWVDFEYDTDIRIGGSWFTNFWMLVDFDLGHEIKKEAGILEENFLGFHITICSDKVEINNKQKDE